MNVKCVWAATGCDYSQHTHPVTPSASWHNGAQLRKHHCRQSALSETALRVTSITSIVLLRISDQHHLLYWHPAKAQTESRLLAVCFSRSSFPANVYNVCKSRQRLQWCWFSNWADLTSTENTRYLHLLAQFQEKVSPKVAAASEIVRRCQHARNQMK
jgi:hypothetical protein